MSNDSRAVAVSTLLAGLGVPLLPRRTPLPIGKQYLPNDNGKSARLRRLRQRTRGLTLSIDQEFRLSVWMKTEPAMLDGRVNTDTARMVIVNSALCQAEDTGLPFSDVMDALLDKLEREQRAGIVASFLQEDP